jgi:hypothetical protein
MHKLEEQLKDVMLKTVDFQLDGKSIKKGKIKVFNTKQFFIRFKFESESENKEYDLPYPFRVVKIPDGYLFDYSLSAFCPRTEETYWRMRMMNKTEASKLHDSHLYVLTLSSYTA